jgi:hypothetical protein
MGAFFIGPSFSSQYCTSTECPTPCTAQSTYTRCSLAVDIVVSLSPTFEAGTAPSQSISTGTSAHTSGLGPQNIKVTMPGRCVPCTASVPQFAAADTSTDISFTSSSCARPPLSIPVHSTAISTCAKVHPCLLVHSLLSALRPLYHCRIKICCL